MESVHLHPAADPGAVRPELSDVAAAAHPGDDAAVEGVRHLAIAPENCYKAHGLRNCINMTEYLQSAPFPRILEDLVDNLRYRPGWLCRLESIDRGQGSEGLTLIITTLGYDSYNPETGQHYR